MKGKFSGIFLILILISASSAYSVERSENRKLIEMNFDPTYIGFPIDISEKSGNRFNQLFESQLNLPLHWFDFPKEEYEWGISGFVVVNGKLTIRMYRQQSSPIKTPSFMPQGYYYFWIDPVNNLIREYFKTFYFSVMLSHYSNGQSGDFYTDKGTVNTDTGNFSTNFFEFAANTVSNKYLWIHIAYQWHPGFNREPELSGQYETGRAILSLRQFIFFNKCDLQIFGSVSYAVTGKKYIQAPEHATSQHPAITAVKAKPKNNFNYQLQLSLRPRIFEDISLFLRYDYGYDYYNIHFQERINRILIGLSGYVNRQSSEPEPQQ